MKTENEERNKNNWSSEYYEDGELTIQMVEYKDGKKKKDITVKKTYDINRFHNNQDDTDDQEKEVK